MAKTKYNILSPDGFTIERDKSYKSLEEAEAAFEAWKKRYEHQGYYSSNNGRIPLDELRIHCTFIG